MPKEYHKHGKFSVVITNLGEINSILDINYSWNLLLCIKSHFPIEALRLCTLMSSWLFSGVPSSKALLGPLSFILRLGCTSWLSPFPLVTPSLLPTEILPPSPLWPSVPHATLLSLPLLCSNAGADCSPLTPRDTGMHRVVLAHLSPRQYTSPNTCTPAHQRTPTWRGWLSSQCVPAHQASSLVGHLVPSCLSMQREANSARCLSAASRPRVTYSLHAACKWYFGQACACPVLIEDHEVLTSIWASTKSLRSCLTKAVKWLQHCEWLSVTQKILLCVISHWNQLKCNFLVGKFWSDIDRSAKAKANKKILITKKLFLATHVRAAQQIGITVQYQREGQKLCISLQRAHKGLGTASATARHCLWHWWQQQWHQEYRNWPKLRLLSDHTGRMGSCTSALWEQVSMPDEAFTLSSTL